MNHSVLYSFILAGLLGLAGNTWAAAPDVTPHPPPLKAQADPGLFPHLATDIPDAEEIKLRDAESLLLGPQHASEHADARARAKAAKQAMARNPIDRFFASLMAFVKNPPRLDNMLASALGTAHAATGTPAQVGTWSTPVRLPIVGIHATLLSTGKILFWSYRPPKTTSAGVAYLWNPANNTGRRIDPPNNLWCGGQTLLADGRMVVAGGNLAYAGPTKNARGLNQIYIFNPYNETWIRQPDMRHGRWYPTLTTLADGRVVITSGFTEVGDGTMNQEVELFTPSVELNGVGSVKLVSTYAIRNFYPHQFVLPDGKMLLAGPGRVEGAILNPANWSWTDIPNVLIAHTAYSSGVLLPGGPAGSSKAMLMGGRDSGVVHASTEVFDAANPTAGWKYAAPMPQPRHNQNTIILPDGKLLTIGGNSGADNYSQAQREAVLYDPLTNVWTRLAAQTDQRAYHSTALLLPDGRVVSAGDDDTQGGGGAATDTVEFYAPPYLFRGARPVISAAPNVVLWGQSFFIGTPSAVTRAVLMAPSATTHANNMHQRLVELSITPGTGGINAVAPASPQIAPPGYYMLFLLNSSGVPSVAKWVRVGGTTLQFSAGSYNFNEGSGVATILVTRSGSTTEAVTVKYATSNGSAIAGSDYTATSGTISFAAGDGAAKTFTVPITNDTVAEPNETVKLTLSNPSGGATVGVPTTATLTIVNDD